MKPFRMAVKDKDGKRLIIDVFVERNFPSGSYTFSTIDFGYRMHMTYFDFTPKECKQNFRAYIQSEIDGG